MRPLTLIPANCALANVAARQQINNKERWLTLLIIKITGGTGLINRSFFKNTKYCSGILPAG